MTRKKKKVVNPLTNRPVTVGGSLHTQLVNQGVVFAKGNTLKNLLAGTHPTIQDVPQIMRNVLSKRGVGNRATWQALLLASKGPIKGTVYLNQLKKHYPARYETERARIFSKIRTVVNTKIMPKILGKYKQGRPFSAHLSMFVTGNRFLHVYIDVDRIRRIHFLTKFYNPETHVTTGESRTTFRNLEGIEAKIVEVLIDALPGNDWMIPLSISLDTKVMYDDHEVDTFNTYPIRKWGESFQDDLLHVLKP